MNIRKSSIILLVVLFSLSLIGCGGGGNGGSGGNITPLATVSEAIDSEGGTIEIAGGKGESLTMEIPEQALLAETDISVSLVDDPNGIPSADSLFPRVILGPEGTVFEKPIYLTFQITDETLQGAGITSLDEVADYLNVYYWDEGRQLWEPLTIYQIDSNANTVIAETDHFSQFQVVVNYYGIERTALLSQIKKGESFRMEVVTGSRKTDGKEDLMANISFAFQQTLEAIFTPDSEVAMEYVFKAPDEIGFHYLEIYSPIARVLLWRQQLVVDYETNVSDYADLIERYSPILVFGKWDIEPWNKSFPNGEELYLPTSIESVLEDSKLGFGKIGLTTLDIVENPTFDDLSKFSDTRHIFDFKGDEKTGASDEKVIYATAVEQDGYIYLQYWFFYPFDAKSGDIIPCLRNCGSDSDCCLECFLSELESLQFLTSHYGDFESVTVVLKRNGLEIEEEYVAYGQHLIDQRMKYLDGDEEWIGDGAKVPWTNVEKDKFHPYIYIALGSHGCYPREGIYGVYPKVLGIEVEYTEKSGGGKEWYPNDYSIEYLSRMADIYPDSEQWESYKFLLFSGQWGNNRWRFADVRLMTHNHKWFVVDWVNGLEEVSFGDIEPPENILPVAEITSPLADANFVEGNEIAFNGSGTDAEDGALSGDSLVWTSDKDGEIGKGGSFNANDLSVGSHTITLTATDSDGATDSDSVAIAIIESPEPEPEPLTNNLPWPMFQHDAQNSGRSQYKGPEEAPNLKWIIDTGDYLYHQPLVGKDGIIYLTNYTSDTNQYCLKAYNLDGSLRWKYTPGDPNICLRPAIDISPAIGSDGVIYLPLMTGIYAVNPDGTLKWKKDYSVSGHLVIGLNDVLYFHGYDISGNNGIYTGGIYAISPDGVLKWSCNFDYTHFRPSVGLDGTVYFLTETGNLMAVNESGIKWQYIADRKFIALPAISPDGVIYPGTITDFYAINPDGTMKWKYQSGLWYQFDSAIVGSDNTLYIPFNATIFAINSEGVKKWMFAFPADSSPTRNTLLIDKEGSVYIGTNNSLIAVNSDGTEKWKYEDPNSNFFYPVIGGEGLLYVGCRKSFLCAFGN